MLHLPGNFTLIRNTAITLLLSDLLSFFFFVCYQLLKGIYAIKTVTKMKGHQKDMLRTTKNNSLVVNQSFLTENVYSFKPYRAKCSQFLKDHQLSQEIAMPFFFFFFASSSFLFLKKQANHKGEANPNCYIHNCKRRVIGSR